MKLKLLLCMRLLWVYRVKFQKTTKKAIVFYDSFALGITAEM
jgi:hypothetical protein